ncbi:hypothetical protein [Photobacterium phage PDCC-1]|uniref:Uncharacterized protein n=1 Tax=Photobacterium phage PDCC-1 TaxID=2664246 RepID=A0A6B9J2G6_9CAUD|nr:hypothetical protein HWC77_gp194 [Photobacterium phage PDCC-1]QGZ14557.1 hypothetical protein [Photobacterium phage PDCC-1]
MNHFIETLLFQQFYDNLDQWLALRFKAIEEGLLEQPCGQVVRFNELDVTYQITRHGVVRVHVDWLQHRAYGMVFDFHKDEHLAVDFFKDTFKKYVGKKRVEDAKFKLTAIVKHSIPEAIMRSMESGTLKHYEPVQGNLGTPFSAYVQPRVLELGGVVYELVFSFQNSLGGYEECVMGDLEVRTWTSLTDTTC